MSSDALPLLSIRGVGKTYAQPVLAEIDLQLFGGEVLALTGENGAGKSTLSKIVGGLERPGATPWRTESAGERRLRRCGGSPSRTCPPSARSAP